jgi:hypothetical protein
MKKQETWIEKFIDSYDSAEKIFLKKILFESQDYKKFEEWMVKYNAVIASDVFKGYKEAERIFFESDVFRNYKKAQKKYFGKKE